MGINVTYGPVSAYGGLGLMAGRADATRFNSQEDLQFLGMMQQAQARANQLHAQQVQQALGLQEFNSDLGLRQQQVQLENQRALAEQANAQRQFNFNVFNQGREANLRQQSINNMSNWYGGRLGNMQDNTALRQQVYGDKQDAINALPSDVQDTVRATGHLPPAGANPTAQLQREYQNLTASIAQEQRAAKSYEVDPKDLVGPKSQPGGVPGHPEVAKGFEDQWTASQQRITAAQQRQAAIEQQLQQFQPPLKTIARPKAARGQAPDQEPSNQQQGQPTVVHDAQEYAQLPSGAKYIDSADGQTYIKR